MLTSSKMTSGLRCFDFSIASRPSTASPQISQSVCRSKRERIPCLTISWSSAIKIRTGPVSVMFILAPRGTAMRGILGHRRKFATCSVRGNLNQLRKPASVGMKKENKEDPPEDPSVLPGETIWQFGIFHTVFPVGTNSRTLWARARLGRQTRNSPSVRSRLLSVTKLSDKHPIRLKRQGVPLGGRLGSRQQTDSRRKAIFTKLEVDLLRGC